ncbi:IS200/IS605 family transposase [Dawidia soli]|uniref:IS200/IS605 family transposase n=1 Tax=Dawidia soli TaxID=2782352 RepID=A0AAP2D854_9BACT|nr:IS200/IS605 family transposase [Dawidia soli]MBT1686924.1 IS200/IS605 family transposase [Dawidia soli]
MSQSLVKIYTHIVFSTKNREHLIQPGIEENLHRYLAGICQKLDCHAVQIGGYTDHVHILCTLSRKITLIKLVEELKSHSSKWIKAKDAAFANFYWQNGYGAFSVNPSEIDRAQQYIGNQHEHHKTTSFKDEYRAFLNKYKIAFEERHVWD